MNSNSNKPELELGEYAESRIKMYAERFAACSDDELREIRERESHSRGCGSERGYYLYALHGECKRRGLGKDAASDRLASKVVFVED